MPAGAPAGEGWDAFAWTAPVSVGWLSTGEHQLTVEVRGGDDCGVELDVIRLRWKVPLPVR